MKRPIVPDNMKENCFTAIVCEPLNRARLDLDDEDKKEDENMVRLEQRSELGLLYNE